MKLIHISDTHLTLPGKEIYGLDPLDRLERCIEDINQHHRDADLCVITGDLAHLGETAAYENLKMLLRRLIVPSKLILGNHDHRQRFLSVFPETIVDDYGYLQEALETDAGIFLFLDTNQPGTHQGWYCVDRQTWLRQQLQSADSRPVYLFMHHPPFPVYLTPLDQIGLKQADEFSEICTPFSNIRHLFFGHVHRPVSGSWQGVTFTALKATNHQTGLNFSAIDAIPGSHEPPAYAIAFIRPETIVVHFHDFLDDSPRYYIEDPPGKRIRVV
jgi:3',5'-cyclic AMP phosphodiesterase CpdA